MDRRDARDFMEEKVCKWQQELLEKLTAQDANICAREKVVSCKVMFRLECIPGIKSQCQGPSLR